MADRRDPVAAISACAYCACPQPLHAFDCPSLVLASTLPPLERPEHPYDNAAQDRAEHELEVEAEREFERDPDWMWGAA